MHDPAWAHVDIVRLRNLPAIDRYVASVSADRWQMGRLRAWDVYVPSRYRLPKLDGTRAVPWTNLVSMTTCMVRRVRERADALGVPPAR